MTKKIVFGVAAVAIAVVMAPSASASCLGIRNATTFGSATAYWHGNAAGTLTGQTWQLGSPGSWSTGNCNTNSAGPLGAMVYFSGAGANLNLDMASCGVGCPASGSTLVVLTQNKLPGNAGSEFMLDTIVETPLNPSANFDYGSQGDHNMVPIPRPRVTASARVGGQVNLQVAFDSITGGLYGPNAGNAVTGFRLLQKASATDPGRDASAYDAAPAAVVANPGGTGTTSPVVVACPDLTDRWIAVQLSFEGGVVLGDAVSAAVQVRCDPALANPKFKTVIPKKVGAPRTTPNN